MTSVLSAQMTADTNFAFTDTLTFPEILPHSFTSPYVECVAPAVAQQESSLVQLQRVYEQQKVILVEQRGRARVSAWAIAERSARNRANRDIDRAYRDNLRILDRWFRDQEKVIRRQFKDAENICSDQFDSDIDSPDELSSSSSSRSRSSHSSSSSFAYFSSSFPFVACVGNDLCLPRQTCLVHGGEVTNPDRCGNQDQMNEGYACCNLLARSSSRSSLQSSRPICGNHKCEAGEGIYCPPCDAFPCTQSCAIGTCPQDCLSSSSSSEWIFYPQETSGTQQIPSCQCQTVCDPSGSPCMAVCPAQC